jgi:hypothetical protein
MDYEDLTSRCTQHLADLGHRSIALVNRSAELVAAGYGPAHRAQEGFSRVVAERGLTGVELCCADDAPAGQTCVESLLADHPEVTAIATINEAARAHPRCLSPFRGAAAGAWRCAWGRTALPSAAAGSNRCRTAAFPVPPRGDHGRREDDEKELPDHYCPYSEVGAKEAAGESAVSSRVARTSVDLAAAIRAALGRIDYDALSYSASP